MIGSNHTIQDLKDFLVAKDKEMAALQKASDAAFQPWKDGAEGRQWMSEWQHLKDVVASTEANVKTEMAKAEMSFVSDSLIPCEATYQEAVSAFGRLQDLYNRFHGAEANLFGAGQVITAPEPRVTVNVAPKAVPKLAPPSTSTGRKPSVSQVASMSSAQVAAASLETSPAAPALPLPPQQTSYAMTTTQKKVVAGIAGGTVLAIGIAALLGKKAPSPAGLT